MNKAVLWLLWCVIAVPVPVFVFALVLVFALVFVPMLVPAPGPSVIIHHVSSITILVSHQSPVVVRVGQIIPRIGAQIPPQPRLHCRLCHADPCMCPRTPLHPLRCMRVVSSKDSGPAKYVATVGAIAAIAAIVVVVVVVVAAFALCEQWELVCVAEKFNGTLAQALCPAHGDEGSSEVGGTNDSQVGCINIAKGQQDVSVGSHGPVDEQGDAKPELDEGKRAVDG